MSNVIDQNVVQMKFDNSNFEKNVSQSMSTLQKLKESLSFGDAAKDINKSLNGIDTSKLNKAIDTIQYRFSTLGVITTTIISNLTTDALNGIKKVANAISSQIKSGGITRALNLESAKFQLEGLGVAWNDIYGSIDTAVSGTAYSLDQAAKIASQLVASGVSIYDTFDGFQGVDSKFGDSVNEMLASLATISGVAAMTSSDFESIGSIFTTVAGQGRLMTMQLRQLETKGLNAAATIANYLGKTEAEARELVSDGKVDYETFVAAMSTYADHAAAANRTFTGVTSNIKSAFSRMGALFYSPLLENDGPLIKFLEQFQYRVKDLIKVMTPFSTAITTVINKILDFGTTLVTNWNMSGIFSFFTVLSDGFNKTENDISGITLAYEGLKNILESIIKIGSAIGSAFKNIFLSFNADYIFDIIKAFNDFSKKLIVTEDTLTKIKKTFETFFLIIKTATTFIKKILITLIKSISNIFGVFNSNIYSAIEFINTVIQKINEWVNNSETLNNALNDISEGVKLVAESIKNVISQIINFIKTNTLLKEILEKIGSLADIIKNKFEKIFGKNATVFTVIINGLKKTIDTIFDILKNIQEPINNLLNKIYNILKGAGSGIVDIIKTAFSTISDTIVNLYKASGGITNFLKNIFSYIGKLIQYIAESDTSLSNLLDTITKIAKTKFITDLGGFLSRSSMTLGAFKANLIDFTKSTSTIAQSSIDTTTKLSRAILELAVALLILSTIDEKALGRALGTIEAILLMFSYFITTISKTITPSILKITKGGIGFKGGTGSEMAALSSVIIGMAASLIIIAFAVKKLGSLSISELGKGLLAMAAILGMLIGVIAALNAFTKAESFDQSSAIQIKNLAKVMKTIGIALLICVASVKILSGIETSQLWQGVLAMVAILSALTLVILALSAIAKMNANNNLIFKGTVTKQVEKLAKMMSKISISLLIATVSVKMLAKLSVDEIHRGMSSMAAILTSLTLVILALSVIAKLNVNSKASNQVAKLASVMITISIAVLIIAQSVKSLGNLSQSEMEKGLLSLTVILGSLVGVIGLLSIISLINYGAGVGNKITSLAVDMVIISVAVSIIGNCIKKIGELGKREYQQGLDGVLYTLLMLSSVVTALSFLPASGAKIAAASASLILLAIAAKILADVIIMFGSVDSGTMWQGLAGMAAALLTFVIALYAIEPVTPVLLSLAAAFLAFGAAAILFGAGLALTGLGLVNIAAGLAALVAVLPAICAAIIGSLEILLVGIVDISVDLAVAIFNLGCALIDGLYNLIVSRADTIIQIIVYLIDIVCEAIVQSSVVIAGAVMELLISVLSIIAENIGPILEKITVIILEVVRAVADIIVGALSIILDVLGEFLSTLSNYDFGDLGTAIIWAAGLIVFFGLLATAATVGLVAGALLIPLALLLVEFGNTISPFIEQLKNMDPNAVSAAKALVEVILALTVAEMLSGASALGNLLGTLLGGSVFDQLREFGQAIVDFAGIIAPLSTEDLLKTVLAAQAMKDMAIALQMVPTSGGLLDSIFGSKDISTFADGVGELGKSIVNMASNLKDVTVDDIEKIHAMVEVCNALAELENNLKDHGGWLNENITGDSSLKSFADQLVPLAESLSAMNQVLRTAEITSTELEAIDSVIDIANKLSELENNLKDHDGWDAAISGDSSLTSFANGVVDFGEAMGNLNSALKGGAIDEESLTLIDSVIDIATKLSELENGLKDHGGWENFWEGDSSLVTFTKSLTDSLPGLKEFFEESKKIPSDGFTAATNVINCLSEFTNLCSGIENSDVVAEIFDSISNIDDLVDPLVDFFNDISEIENFDAGITAFQSIGSMLTALPSDVLSNAETLPSLFNALNNMDDIGESIFDFYDSFDGIEDLNTAEARLAFSSLCSTLNIAMNNLPDVELMTSFMDALSDMDGVGESIFNFYDSFDGIEDIDTQSVRVALASLCDTLKVALNNMVDGDTIASFFNGISSIENVGKPIANFYNSFEDLNDTVKARQALTGIASSLKVCINNMPDGSTISSFFSALKNINGVGNPLSEFYKAFPSDLNTSNAGSAISTISSKFKELSDSIGADTLTSLIAALYKLNLAGKGILNFFNDLSQVTVATDSIDTIISNIKKLYTELSAETLNTFVSSMNNSLGQIASGVKAIYTNFCNAFNALLPSFKSKMSSVGKYIISSLSSAISTNTIYSDFYRVGQYVGWGFADGIDSTSSTVYRTAYYLGRKAVTAAEDATKVQSPSREFMRIGKYCAEGMTIGINKNADKVAEASYNMGDGAVSIISDTVSKIADAINGDLDTNPVIRPVLDLDDLRNGVSSMNSLFNSSYGIGVYGENQNGELTGSGGSVVNFTQNNYSPKALSRFDIYRQTRNQINTIKGVIG